MNKSTMSVIIASAVLISVNVNAAGQVSDEVIAQQRENLALATKDKGFGPQSPRDIDTKQGKNTLLFSHAPSIKKMNLCNIHFHKNT